MTELLKKLGLVAALIFSVFALAACSDNDAEDAMDDVGDAVEDAADEIDDAADDVADGIKDATN